MAGDSKKPNTNEMLSKFAKMNAVAASAATTEKSITSNQPAIDEKKEIEPVKAEPSDQIITSAVIHEKEAEGKKDSAVNGSLSAILQKNRMTEMTGTSRLQKNNHEWLKMLSTAESIGTEVLVNNILDLFFMQNKDEVTKIIRRHMKKF